MPKEIFPCSYQCDCGHQMDVFENTIREMKRDSMRRRSVLADGPEDREHLIVFEGGTMVDIICPIRKQGSRKRYRTPLGG